MNAAGQAFRAALALTLLTSAYQFRVEFREAARTDCSSGCGVPVAGEGERVARGRCDLGMSGEAVKKAVHRMRHAITSCSARNRHTVADPTEVEEEMRYLCGLWRVRTPERCSRAVPLNQAPGAPASLPAFGAREPPAGMPALPGVMEKLLFVPTDGFCRY